MNFGRFGSITIVIPMIHDKCILIQKDPLKKIKLFFFKKFSIFFDAFLHIDTKIKLKAILVLRKLSEFIHYMPKKIRDNRFPLPMKKIPIKIAIFELWKNIDGNDRHSVLMKSPDEKSPHTYRLSRVLNHKLLP
jgi:hypothetical protein